MKLIWMIFYLTILNFTAFGSCLVGLKEGEDYHVVIWRHAEQAQDQVVHKDCSGKDLEQIAPLLAEHKAVTFTFNQGELTALGYEDQEAKAWAELSSNEKDMVRFVMAKFNVQEK